MAVSMLRPRALLSALAMPVHMRVKRMSTGKPRHKLASHTSSTVVVCLVKYDRHWEIEPSYMEPL